MPRRGRARPGIVLLWPLLLVVAPSPGHGQPVERLDVFLERVRHEARRFRDVDVAIAEGYRRLGPDFPGMGEHWVHPGLVIAGELDPRRPPVLAYTPIDGERKLLGFAFTRVLGPGEAVPGGPFPPDAWHDHTGGVDEESLLLSGPVSMHAGGEGFRLSMVHVWTEVRPTGDVLDQNNWALPFLREGLAVPAGVSSEAARGLSLANVGMSFYELLLRDGIGLEPEEMRIVLGALRERGATVRAWIDGRPDGKPLRRSDLAELEEAWTEVWRELEGRVPPEVWTDLEVIRGP